MRRTICLALVLAVLAGCGGGDKKDPQLEPKLKELGIKDTQVGTGVAVENGDFVWVYYKGTLANGKQFDSNMPDGMPFEVRTSDGKKMTNVIEGWDKGVIGMKVGGTRELSIPYKMAYGDQGNPTIPGKSDLFFTVKAVYIQKKGEDNVFDAQDITVGSGQEAKVGDTVTFHYKGAYLNGTVFDDSEQRPSGSKPVTAKIGETSGAADRMILALDYGLRGMKVGGVRKITAPPSLIFGHPGNDTISGDQPCVFTVKLLKIGS